MEDQYTDLKVVLVAVQKEVFALYLALRTADRKGFLLVATFHPE
jgi:hypothetical protein